MIIDITASLTTGEISAAFSEGFPCLGISFFKRAHAPDEASPIREKIASDSVLSDFAGNNLPGAIEIHGWHRTADVEQEFNRLFQLNVQVMRLEAGSWVQTVDTDTRTLQEQSEAARLASQEWMENDKT